MLRILLKFVFILIVAGVLSYFTFSPFKQVGDIPEAGLKSGKYIFISRISYLTNKPQIGDVIVYSDGFISKIGIIRYMGHALNSYIVTSNKIDNTIDIKNIQGKVVYPSISEEAVFEAFNNYETPLVKPEPSPVTPPDTNVYIKANDGNPSIGASRETQKIYNLADGYIVNYPDNFEITDSEFNEKAKAYSGQVKLIPLNSNKKGNVPETTITIDRIYGHTNRYMELFNTPKIQEKYLTHFRIDKTETKDTTVLVYTAEPGGTDGKLAGQWLYYITLEVETPKGILLVTQTSEDKTQLNKTLLYQIISNAEFL